MFYTGYARLDITPSLGAPLAGAAKVRYADGMLDPLELCCVAFSDGENKAVLITADFLYVMENAATKMRELIEKKCGVPADCVFMQGLHQHTSLRIGSKPHLNGGFDDQPYLEMLSRKYCDVVTLALQDLKETALFQGEQETAKPISFIRRYRMKDGKCKTNPSKGNPDVVGPIGEADNTVRLLRMKRQGGKEIALVNFSTHPDVVTGTKISADWPGFVRRMTEQALPDTHCILVNGAQGDTNHLNPAVLEREAGIEHAAMMGRVITDTVLALWDKTLPMETGRVWGKVSMEYVPTNQRGIERVDECIALEKGFATGEIPRPKNFAEAVDIWRISQLPRETLFQKVPVCILGIVKAVFIGFGGEPFTAYAARAREDGKELYVICACLTGGGQGYLPTRDAFEEGGYEASNSRFDASVAEILPESAARLLEEYRALR